MAVEDSNDNIPYFTSTVYDAVAYESSPIGTSVIQVTALDKDNGINGQLTYSIEAGVMSSLKFSVLCSSVSLIGDKLGSFSNYVSNLSAYSQETLVVCLASTAPLVSSS